MARLQAETSRHGFVHDVRVKEVADEKVCELLMRYAELQENNQALRHSLRLVRESEARFRRVVAGAEAADDRAEDLRDGEKLVAVGALASSVAHDVGNVLQGVMGCLNIALSASTPSERALDYTRQALTAARSGAMLVGQLARCGREEQSNCKPIAIDAVIRGCGSLLQRLLGDNIQLDIDARAPGCRLMADPIQIEQILMNLAGNARDAMPEGGRLSIQTEEAGQEADASGRVRPFVRLQVRDTGCGMDRETQARVFEPFYTTKAPGKGTGIGLATVRAVTRELGGHVQLNSEVGRGTAFVFTFPTVAEACPINERSERREAHFAGRVLLLEDDASVRAGVRQYLEDLGFEVVEARNAVEALSCTEGPFSVLVSDVVPPEVGGRRVCEILRHRYHDLQALYISAHPAHYLLEKGLLQRNDALLQKPFERGDLSRHLAELCPALLGASMGYGAGASCGRA